MSPLAAFAVATCAAVSPGSDHVLLRDLAPAFPAVEISMPETPIALAPAPGVERRFEIAELRRIAARLNLAAEPEHEVCVTRPVAPLQPARILNAMRENLPNAAIELVDFSRWPVPEGMLEFPLSGLREDRWTGTVCYGGSRRFTVWARVTVRLSQARVVAVHDVRAGERLDDASFRVEHVDAAPSPVLYATSLADLAGKRLRRPVRAGTAIRAEWLDTVPDVTRGEAVRVAVRSGAAILEFDGQAQASGSTGQTIPVLNPQTHKRFRTRIEGHGRVSLEGAPQ